MRSLASFLAGLPREICLKKGEDENRVWFEFWKSRGKKNLRGIVIQKLKSEGVYYLFLIRGEDVLTFSKCKTPYKKGVHPVTTFSDVSEAIETLKELGFKVSIVDSEGR